MLNVGSVNLLTVMLNLDLWPTYSFFGQVIGNMIIFSSLSRDFYGDWRIVKVLSWISSLDILKDYKV